MKTLKNKFLALLLITTVAFFSCKKQDPLVPVKPETTTSTASTNNPNFTRGQWKVELFQEDGIDGATGFRGYLFTFNSDGTVSVKKDNDVMNGNWSTVKNNNEMKFTLGFSTSPLDDLNGQWDVKYETDVRIALERKLNDSSLVSLTFDRYFAQAEIGNFK